LASKLVQLAILAPVLGGQPVAGCARLFAPVREKRAEHALELELCDGVPLAGAEREQLGRATLGALRELHERPQAHQSPLVVWRLRVNLRPAGDGLGELPAHVLQLREEVGGRQVLRLGLE